MSFLNIMEFISPFYDENCRTSRLSQVGFIRSGVSRCTHLSALPGPYAPARVTRGALVAHRYTYTQPRCRTLQYSTVGFLFRFRCSSGTILLAPFLMVWDWQVSRAGPMLLYWPKLLFPYYSLLLSLPFSSFCL